ncbi:hypothetical protein HOLleu_24895 [Holothuria leucospilota]|uniref:Uncharacterized protein n=1 Tax=Holothuria leucospilota TaxID=206669 RepID=A0A9Q1BS40_HOLLE|nr:hypothetical protein HOLleu_24895 [Holothuria leucospilota]
MLHSETKYEDVIRPLKCNINLLKLHGKKACEGNAGSFYEKLPVKPQSLKCADVENIVFGMVHVIARRDLYANVANDRPESIAPSFLFIIPFPQLPRGVVHK